jgi:hypothetical protein
VNRYYKLTIQLDDEGDTTITSGIECKDDDLTAVFVKAIQTLGMKVPSSRVSHLLLEFEYEVPDTKEERDAMYDRMPVWERELLTGKS